MESNMLDQMHRRIIRNFLDMVIMMELRKHAMSGDDLVNFVRNKFQVTLNSGTVYSYLYFLGQKQFVKNEWVQGKKVYTLTEHGQENAKTFLVTKDKILGLVLNLFIGE